MINEKQKDKTSEILYSEPSSYFPESIRKEFGLGEYAEKKATEKNQKENSDKEQ